VAAPPGGPGPEVYGLMKRYTFDVIVNQARRSGFDRV
jgi:hypothetical protein